jgi:hypothetical protein
MNNITTNIKVPRVIEIDDGEAAIGHIVAHGDTQFDAFDVTGRPIGTYTEFAAAASAVRAGHKGDAE